MKEPQKKWNELKKFIEENGGSVTPVSSIPSIPILPGVCPSCGHCPTCGHQTYPRPIGPYYVGDVWPFGQTWC